MRELTVRIRFDTPCLGATKQHYMQQRRGQPSKKRTCHKFSRTADGKVFFMPQEWQRLLTKAAGVLGRLHREVKDVIFSLEVDGLPHPVETNCFRRFYDKDMWSPHEAFHPGDIIGVSCVVPSSISEDDFWSLMNLLGKYYGISEWKHKEYGRFTVVNVERRGPDPDNTTEPPQPIEVSCEGSLIEKK